MHTTKRYISSGFNALLFCLVTFAGGLSVSASYADEMPEATGITIENQVNINTADAETLALALDGVGLTRAMDIIAYREEHGDFESVEQLQDVRGIGPATLERNRSRILLTDRTE